MSHREFLLLILLIFIVIIVNNANIFAQSSPAINYPSIPVYTVDSAITPLSPVNKGGAIFPANYLAPVTFTPYIAPFSLAIDGANNIYTTNNSTGELSKFSPTGAEIFTIPTGHIHASEVAVDRLGNIYVSQFAINSVLKYSSTGVLLATIPGFNDPYGIAFDAANNAYVTNYHSGAILKINAGATTATAYLSGFTKPYGIVFDHAGNLYISEEGPGDIIKVAAGTLKRTTFASGFNNPRHLSKDHIGNIYVADYENNAIERIYPSGKVTPILTTGLNEPRQVAFDSTGNLYIADYGSNTLLKSPATPYSISGQLPDGLTFDPSNGRISGTPGESTCTVSAYNVGGVDSVALTFNVQQPPDPVPKTPGTNGLTDNQADSVIVHHAISPNGDGKNDFLLIEGIENYPNNKVTILDKSGVAIFTINGYNNSNKVFDGRSNVNGKLQLPGTYYYVLQYYAHQKIIRKTGFIILKLQ